MQRNSKNTQTEMPVNRPALNIFLIIVLLVGAFKERELRKFRRDELQDVLDAKANTLSFSLVDHLRWDMKQIF